MNTGLRQRNHIHIAFDGNDGFGRLAALRLAGLARPQSVIEHPPLVKQFGFRRVQIFCRGIGRKRTATEGDDAPAQILDREHDAIAKTVIGNRNSSPCTTRPHASICSRDTPLPARNSFNALRDSGA